MLSISISITTRAAGAANKYLALGTSSLLDFVLRDLRVLRPCDSRFVCVYVVGVELARDRVQTCAVHASQSHLSRANTFAIAMVASGTTFTFHRGYIPQGADVAKDDAEKNGDYAGVLAAVIAARTKRFCGLEMTRYTSPSSAPRSCERAAYSSRSMPPGSSKPSPAQCDMPRLEGQRPLGSRFDPRPRRVGDHRHPASTSRRVAVLPRRGRVC